MRTSSKIKGLYVNYERCTSTYPESLNLIKNLYVYTTLQPKFLAVANSMELISAIIECLPLNLS